MILFPETGKAPKLRWQVKIKEFAAVDHVTDSSVMDL